MNKKEGYLVVLKSPDDIKNSKNPLYRGFYRIPPWSKADFEKGFNDPYLFGGFTNESGLIRDVQTSSEVIDLFAKILPFESMEIIYARICNDQPLLSESNFHFLGFDVAGSEAPFWSIVADFPFAEIALQRFLANLNDSGLINLKQEAEVYLETYISLKLPHYDSPLVVWEIYYVNKPTL